MREKKIGVGVVKYCNSEHTVVLRLCRGIKIACVGTESGNGMYGGKEHAVVITKAGLRSFDTAGSPAENVSDPRCI